MTIFYVGLVSVMFSIFPSNPEAITAPMDFINSFRMVTFDTMVMFYLVLGIMFGMMWNKDNSHVATQINLS